jgi:hypothetical protein
VTYAVIKLKKLYKIRESDLSKENILSVSMIIRPFLTEIVRCQNSVLPEHHRLTSSKRDISMVPLNIREGDDFAGIQEQPFYCKVGRHRLIFR